MNLVNKTLIVSMISIGVMSTYGRCLQFRFSNTLEKTDHYRDTFPMTLGGSELLAVDIDRDGQKEIIIPGVTGKKTPTGWKDRGYYRFNVLSFDPVSGRLIQRVDLMVFEKTRKYYIGLCSNPIIMDFNKDGWLDLFFSTSSDGAGWLYYFDPIVKRFIPSQLKINISKKTWFRHFIRAHDVNHDGVPDFLVTIYTNLYLLLSRRVNGILDWVDVSRTNLPNPNSTNNVVTILFEDFDRDGDQDIFIGRYFALDEIYQNVGFGKYRKWPYITPTRSGSGSTSVAASGDLDGNGYPDILIGEINVSSLVSKNLLWMNYGRSGFKLVVLADQSGSCPLFASHARLVDFDQDGDLDGVVAVRVSCTKGTFFYENDGKGNLKLVNPIGRALLASTWDISMIPGDFDDDGDQDLLFWKRWVYPPVQMWRNLKRQLFTPAAPRIGRMFKVQAWSMDPPAAFLVYFSLGQRRIPWVHGGAWWLDPFSMVYGGTIVVLKGSPAPTNSISVPIPQIPSLVGQYLFTQAFVVTPKVDRILRVTGAWGDPILP